MAGAPLGSARVRTHRIPPAHSQDLPHPPRAAAQHASSAPHEAYFGGRPLGCVARMGSKVANPGGEMRLTLAG